MIACKEVGIRTVMEYATIANLDLQDWMDLLQTLMALAKKIEGEKLKFNQSPESISRFVAFKLDEVSVIRMIEAANPYLLYDSPEGSICSIYSEV